LCEMRGTTLVGLYMSNKGRTVAVRNSPGIVTPQRSWDEGHRQKTMSREKRDEGVAEKREVQGKGGA